MNISIEEIRRLTATVISATSHQVLVGAARRLSRLADQHLQISRVPQPQGELPKPKNATILKDSPITNMDFSSVRLQPTIRVVFMDQTIEVTEGELPVRKSRPLSKTRVNPFRLPNSS